MSGPDSTQEFRGKKEPGDNSNSHSEHVLCARHTHALLHFIYPVTYEVGTIITSILQEATETSESLRTLPQVTHLASVAVWNQAAGPGAPTTLKHYDLL